MLDGDPVDRRRLAMDEGELQLRHGQPQLLSEVHLRAAGSHSREGQEWQVADVDRQSLGHVADQQRHVGVQRAIIVAKLNVKAVPTIQTSCLVSASGADQLVMMANGTYSPGNIGAVWDEDMIVKYLEANYLALK